MLNDQESVVTHCRTYLVCDNGLSENCTKKLLKTLNLFLLGSFDILSCALEPLCLITPVFEKL